MRYSYDFEDHLIGLNGGTVSFAYDGDGNRVAKTINGVTTRYLVDTNNPTGYAQVVDELDDTQVKRAYTYGHSLVSQRQLINGQWQVSFYGYDGHGSVRQLFDFGGAITDAYAYDAFGNLIAVSGTTPNQHLYVGEQLDPNTGFYYLRARYLSSSTGRFQTMDSFEGGNHEPRTLHKYAYAENDAVNRIDPSGHMSVGEISVVSMNYNTLAAMSVLSLATVCSFQYALGETANYYGADISSVQSPCVRNRGPKPTVFHYTGYLEALGIQVAGFMRASYPKKFGGFTFPSGAYATDITPTDPSYTQRSLSALFYGGNEKEDVSAFVELERNDFSPLRYPGFPHQWIRYAPPDFPVRVRVKRIGINPMAP